MEYVITANGEYAVLTSNGGFAWTRTLDFASRFKSKARAEKVALKAEGYVEPFWGAPNPKGTKFFTPQSKSKVNRSRPYRNV